jgi:hypothetical protein
MKRKGRSTMKKVAIALALLGGLFASPSFAAVYAGTCTTAPEAQWMTEAAAKAKITDAGYTVAKLKRTRTGNCYEAYVTDKSGKKMELFLDPTNAKIVHSQ